LRRITKKRLPLVEPAVDPASGFATADELNSAYQNRDRRLAFPTTGSAAARKIWRSNLTQALRKTLRLKELGKVPVPTFDVLSEVDCGDYVRQKIVYTTLPGSRVPAYLLKPHSYGVGDQLAAAICPHGHVPGAKDNVVGVTRPVGVAYGHELAKRGIVVLAPDNAGMGERDVSESRKRTGTTGCFLAWSRLNQMGLDLTGLRVLDLMAGVNLLSNLEGVDERRIGCAGLSGGCWLSQVLTALEPRIKAVVLSGFFTSFVQTTWHGHCVCHHPFGIGQLCDMPDISALIAPRPQFVESGISDTPYPHEPAFSMVRQAYELQGAPDAIDRHRYRGGHMFNGKKSIPWLVDRLTEEN